MLTILPCRHIKPYTTLLFYSCNNIPLYHLSFKKEFGQFPIEGTLDFRFFLYPSTPLYYFHCTFILDL